ncbi:MAG TPA: PBP1A family penicillin-binding protein [Kofleriaceae bacterium]|nr:PBP1A family penicillin-binding protein [Kofleriaceae bacterium]
MTIGGGTAIGGRVVIANRRPGGLWWRIPCALAIWLCFAAPVVVGCVALSVLREYAADLPEVPDLDRWRADLPLSTVITAADGSLLAEIPFQRGEEIGHRLWVPRERLPPLLVRAVLAAEDVRFYQHRGVDLQAVARAAWTNYRAGRVVEGASTITQQVARALLPDEIGREETLRRKVREALLARRIERHYPKERILEVYVNQVFLGAGAYGVRAAARAYFDRSLEELDAAQAALIAGLAQAPGRANPFVDPAAARRRRDEVLQRMAAAGFLAPDVASAARAQPLGLDPPPVRYGTIAPWYTERVRRDLEATAPDLYARGLTIETAAQPVLAAEAEERARRHVARVARPAPQVGAVLWDHATGYVEATVGGVAWEDSRYDRATQACRQPGSAFKPIVYAAALASDVITPGTPLRDGPIAEYDEELDVHWKPKNSGRQFRGVALAQDALASSLNAPAVDVLDRAGGKRVIAMARRLGITTELDDVRPLVLGSSCVVPIELAGAFAAFARGGRRAEPIFAVRVRRGGEVLVDRASPYDPSIDPARRLDRMAAVAGAAGEAALDPQTAFLISSMLSDVVARGTGTGARAIGRPAAGKTGTTNENSDAWFVGYTARLVAAVWIGHDDPSRLLGAGRDGAHAALPLWNQLVVLAEGGRAARAVPGAPPPGLVRARVDRETGLLAQPGAGGAIDLWFRRGTEPHGIAGEAADVPVDLSRTSREF